MVASRDDGLDWLAFWQQGSGKAVMEKEQGEDLERRTGRYVLGNAPRLQIRLQRLAWASDVHSNLKV